MRVPLSTYRVQLRREFGFHDAAAIVDYLDDLGVTALYASPYLQAAPGSTHGYDVVDHSRANDELGGEDGRRALVAALVSRGMGQVLDIVPNHMSVAFPRENRWWWDVLEHGTASPYTGWFDIDWDNPYARDPAERGRLLVPALGADPAELSKLELVEEDGHLMLAYYDKRFPVAAGSAVPGDDPVSVASRQHYVLTNWRWGNDELNYRRFFDVTDLAAVRVEDSRVFAETHRLVLQWVRDGELDGLRIDHPDGLADPLGYLQRLADSAPDAWITVEKILEPGESLPASWPVAGTTGYDAMRVVGGVLVDPRGCEPLSDCYAEFVGSRIDFAELAHELRRRAASTVLFAETARLATLLARLHVVDDWREWTDALAELLASFDVYRSYVRPGWAVSSSDADVVHAAVASAARRRPDDRSFYDAVARILLEPRPGLEAQFVTRLQQTTGMVMAKGVEDTAFYRYHRLTALNEVGGDPSLFGVSLADFHADCAVRQRDWPHAMTSLSTHDTKRSEDVRARLSVLAEVPDEWRDAVQRWHGPAQRFREDAGPDANTEYLFWQTLVGAWPISASRLGAYLEKATREAKDHTSWVDPDPAFDRALQWFVRAVFDDGELMKDVSAFVERVVIPGRVNSLAQKLVQLTMPGVPDVYQGSECWDLSLVDPDNRRPVDYAHRRALLARLGDGSIPTVAEDSGAAKLLVVSRALSLRRSHPEWFGASAGYAPLEVTGAAASHVIAFARADSVVTLAPRLPVGLERAGGWRDTTVTLPSAGPWRDALTNAVYERDRLLLADVLDRFPVALLSRA